MPWYDYHLTSTEFEESLQASFRQKEMGEGETFKTPQDMNAFFKARFAKLKH